jgi:glycosyltransferase involved in cell wall biosynthesis
LSNPKLLFLVTEDWYFCSHRLLLAVQAQKRGYDVVVATRVRDHGEEIVSAGLRLIPLGMARRGRNPLRELHSLWEIYHLFRIEQPEIVHLVALKPVIYGVIAALFAGIPRIVCAIAGLGYVFTSRQIKASLMRPVMTVLLRLLLNQPRARVIVQNPDDRMLMINAVGVDPDRIMLIRGAGVDMEAFVPTQETAGTPVVVLASRMLWDKGVGEFVAAAEKLRRQGTDVRMVLVGNPDPENLASVPMEQLGAWHETGVVEWWGQRNDMPQVFAQCNIVCLPSAYGEGIPKVLIEAAASGRPIIGTDAPGCREIVRDRENGLLVPLKDSNALADAIQFLIENPDIRQRMGACGRKIAMAEFAMEKVVAETLAVYEELLTT